jgi:hypothetical protein
LLSPFSVIQFFPDYVFFSVGKNSEKTMSVKKAPSINLRRPGVDVMITIFYDFSQFSAKKIGVFLKYECYDQVIIKCGFVLSQKRQFFR